MVTEDYVSFEVAKLLKEKGFDEPCECFYDSENNDVSIVNGWMNISNSELEERKFVCYSAPTHQMACGWVRKKGYSIEIHATAYGWIWNICKINGTDVCWSGDRGPNSGGAWDDYDECTESALKHCLENLI